VPRPGGACPIRASDLIPEVAVDPVNGNVYAVWMDARFDGGLFVVDHDGIAFTQSADGGRTWSAPIKVNETPATCWRAVNATPSRRARPCRRGV